MAKYKFIDDFYNGTSDDLAEYSKKRDIETFQTAITRPRTPEDARAIANIYQFIYRGTYPYKEMEDQEYIYETFEDPSFVWGLFKTSEDKLVGCFTVVLDYDTRRGYFRGMMILPEFQHKVNSKKLCLSVIRHAYGKAKGRIDVWYNESRTAHSKAQYISTTFGCHPYAVFMNKDRFFNRDESDVLMVAHTRAALQNRSSDLPLILPEIMPFYRLAQERFSTLGNPMLVSDFFSEKDCERARLAYPVALTASTDKFGYQTIKITDSATKAYLTALYTPLARNIEKIKFTATEPAVLYRLLHALLIFGKKRGVKYVEAFVTAYDPQLQQVALCLGFEVLGYVPAWEPQKDSWQVEDRVVFGHFIPIPNSAELLALIPEAQQIVDIVENNFVQRQVVVLESQSNISTS